MKRLFNIFFCILRSKKIFSVEKYKFVIFDCVNSKILSEILPKNQTYIISARVNLIKKILINFNTLSFLIKNLFLRSIQLNYFISLILQIQPKVVFTTIDNSTNFSVLTKYFEGKIKFIAIQNGTRGDIYENENNLNQTLYFQNYFGFSNFDKEIMKKRDIKIKNFFSAGSLKNSYFRKYIKKQTNNQSKKFDICIVCKKIFENDKRFSSKASDDCFTLLNLLAEYVKKHKKSIVIQSKMKNYNLVEKKFIDNLFTGTNYKIDLLDNEIDFNSYKNISSSKLIIGASSTLLREASVYTGAKILCFSTESKDKTAFSGLNLFCENSFEKFEERLNLLFSLSDEEYKQKLERKHDYLMENINTIDYLKEFLKNEN